ncbi:glycosyltransferase family 4 protein [Salegentibacter sp. JZCK2]|uniref:glycosyltransferase family 4 protein n=1 Tax=Salegentibacter tibetensis TaxID=2873600 RepID=UPI001CCBD5FD|nr:glycosyltransferase family 1 protein [Salegentibacter tibetensis]MBZ9729458.1 glycosyltransferase family 4 protein [Salegentibacter tibetensis]
MKIGYEAKRIFHNATGLGNYSRDLVTILSNFYPENNYLLYNPQTTKKQLYKPKNPVQERLPGSSINRFFNNFWRRKNVTKDLQRDNLDIFHGLSGEIPIGLNNTKIKSVVTIHDLIFLRYPEFYSFLDKIIYKRKFQHAVKAADSIIAVSEQTKKDIIDFLEADASKIEVIYQGCQKEYKISYSPAAINDVIKKYKLPKNYLLNVGTVESRKNILAAVKAIKDLDTHLVIVGSLTSYAEKIRTYIKKEGLENKVFFLHGLSTYELAALYQGAEIFIYPSLFEGFGIPIIEALYSKTPVITTNYGCFPEAGGPDSIYVDPTNISEISEAIRSLLNDPAKRKLISEKSFNYAQRFNDENIASQIVSLYNDLLK